MIDRWPSTEFLAAARLIGANVPFWTQGAGGNISEKHDGSLFIKASGARLDALPAAGTVARLEIESSLRGLRILLDRVRDTPGDPELEKAYGDFVAGHSLDRPTFGRASMETGFHLALPGRFVLHFHALGAVLMTEAPRREIETQFEKAGFDLLFVPAIQPGLELTAWLARAPRADVYLLQNHGVILRGETLDIVARWRDLEREFLARAYPAFARFQESRLADYDALVRRPMPLKHYFPDSAVFTEELRRVLRPEGNGFTLAPTATPALHEIWAATALLFEMKPDLAEVPAPWVRDLADLPTERFRRQGAPE